MFSCCSCVIQINAASDTKVNKNNNDTTSADTVSVTEDDVDYTDLVNSVAVDNKITRAEWLELLFDALDIDVRYDLWDKYSDFKDLYDSENNEVVMTAIERGIIGGNNKTFGADNAATRQYVSTTLVNAVGYTTGFSVKCADYEQIEDKTQASTSVYLGLIKLDVYECFNTYKPITAEEVLFILDEIQVMKELEGKNILSFGDSIMYGSGNYNVGIAELLAYRYMMNASDYSYGGATFGYYEGKDQISNQILKAIQNREQPDVILINGGTNDMKRIKAGSISDEFDYSTCGRETFASGMEYALWLLETHFPGVPVIYIRAHDMMCAYEANELYYGSMALDICDKWGINVVDIFSDTEFDAHDDYIKMLYTAPIKPYVNGDSVHPNRAGYYKFYFPLIVEKMLSVI